MDAEAMRRRGTSARNRGLDESGHIWEALANLADENRALAERVGELENPHHHRVKDTEALTTDDLRWTND